MKAVILAAGFGTRLYPLTKNRAKALLEVKGRSLIDHIIDRIPCEEEDIIVVSNGKFYGDFLKWKSDSGRCVKIVNNGIFSNEERRGGISDLWLAIQNEVIDDDVILIHGDTFFDFDLKDFVNGFENEREILLGLHRTSLDDARRFGVVEVSGDAILGIEEKPEKPKSNLVLAGFFIIPQDKLKLIGDYLKTDKDREGITFWIKDVLGSEPVRFFVFEGTREDIGNLETYARVNSSLGLCPAACCDDIQTGIPGKS